MVMYRGMKPATTEELLFMSLVKLRPCCLCSPGEQKSPTEVHHIKRGNKRLGHFYVLPYCKFTHHANASYHTHEERDLWQKLNDELGIVRAWPVSKIVRRDEGLLVVADGRKN
jgi:hypothetical protein